MNSPDDLTIPVNEGTQMMVFDPNPIMDITLMSQNERVGRLWWDPETSQLQFEGDMDESAEVFFGLVKQLWDGHFERTHG